MSNICRIVKNVNSNSTKIKKIVSEVCKIKKDINNSCCDASKIMRFGGSSPIFVPNGNATTVNINTNLGNNYLSTFTGTLSFFTITVDGIPDVTSKIFIMKNADPPILLFHPMAPIQTLVTVVPPISVVPGDIIKLTWDEGDPARSFVELFFE